MFSEGEIAAQLNLSRTPVREAFVRLEAEELVRLVPKRGALVVPVPPQEAEDVLDIREAMETSAVHRLCRDSGSVTSVVDRLRTAIGEQRELARAGDVDTFARADEAFHRMIVMAAGNTLATRFYATLTDRQRRMNRQALQPQRESIDSAVEEHHELVAYIAAGDPAGFAETLRTHLDHWHRREGLR